MNNKLIGSIELNLIDVYLGKHSGYGADDAYYKQSDYFIPSIACQQNVIFEELLNNENVDIRKKLIIDLNELQKEFDKWNKNKGSFRFKYYLRDTYVLHISSLIEFISILHKNGKYEISNELRNHVKQLFDIYKKNEYAESLEENENLDDPIWERWEDYMYYRIVIKADKIEKIFKEIVRPEYTNMRDFGKYSFSEEGKEKLVKSFMRVCLKYRINDFINIINIFDEYEFKSLLDILRNLEFLPIMFQNSNLQKIIKEKLVKQKIGFSDSNSYFILYKKLLQIKLNKSELSFAEKEYSRLKDIRSVDYHRLDVPLNYAALSYVLEKNTFKYYLRKQDGHPFRIYFELGLYSALYIDYIGLLQHNKNVEAVIRDFIGYVSFYTTGTYDQRYLNKDISYMISFIFSASDSNVSILLRLKRLLLSTKSNFSPYHFYLQLFFNNPDIFSRLINEGDLKNYEDELYNWKEDYQSYVDRCFQIALFYSNIDSSKSVEYIIKGINDGILRHGWRKDTIVSHDLIYSLGLLWKNNWEPKNKLIKSTKEILDMTLKVADITDGKETWKGPYNLIELILKYDLDLAYKLKEKLLKNEGYWNYSISLITSFIFEKIKLGFPLDELEEEMKELRKEYDYKGKLRANYYEEIFKVYLEVTISDLYPEDTKQTAFDKAYEKVEEIIKNEIEYFLLDDVKYKNIFIELCSKYKKNNILPVNNKNDSYSSLENEKIEDTNQKFIPLINNATNKKDIEKIYQELSDHSYGRILAEHNHWKKLIYKTYEICKNINLFLELLKKDGFPHYDLATSNSQYYHFGLAEALKNLNTKKETLEYLSKYSGHGGFINIMKAYEVNKDKEMCLKLFDRFLKFCHLLVD
jgi:hypothetical protein